MNTKNFICNNLIMAIPVKVDSISNNQIIVVNGYVPVKIDVVSGTLTETTNNVDAGKLITQSIEISGTIRQGSIFEFNRTAIMQLSLNNIGNKVWGSQELPVIITEIATQGDGIKLKCERKTTLAEFV